MNNSRFIKFEKAYNFREIGNLTTSDGKKIKSAAFFRSDELSKLTLSDQRIFTDLNIKTIIDLRGAKEKQKKEDKIPAGLKINMVNIPVDHKNQDLKQMEFFLFLIKKSKDFDFDKYMREHYFGTAFECTPQIKEIFTLLSDKNNLPALIHCTLGKDRTGFIAAILQLLAGVPRNAVIEDYLATNDNIGVRINQTVRMIRIMSLFRTKKEQIRPLLIAHPEYLNDAIDEIVKQYGTIENYLINACGMDKETINNLKNNLLE